MGIGASMFLLAAGAILNWGVETNPDEVNLNTVGAILMVVGALGLLLTLLLFDEWQPWSRRRDSMDRRDYADRREYFEETVPSTRREVVIEDEPGPRGDLVEDEPRVRRRVVTNRRGSW